MPLLGLARVLNILGGFGNHSGYTYCFFCTIKYMIGVGLLLARIYAICTLQKWVFGIPLLFFFGHTATNLVRMGLILNDAMLKAH
jgi:hypothetical protein